MFNLIKHNLLSSKIFFKEFILFFLLTAAAFLFLLGDLPVIYPLLISLLLGLIIFNFIGSKRRNELENISKVIKEIKDGVIIKAEDINLSDELSGLENEIRLMFEKYRQNIEYLKKLEKMRTEFLANTSHELRTPVFSIQGYIETLLNGALEDEKVNRHFLQKANAHTINLSNLLNDLIDISMIESGEMRMSFRYFDINEYLSDLVEEFKYTAEEKGLNLSYLPAPGKLMLFGDRTKLRQAMVNLIQNAIKYTEKGKVEILVEEEAGYGKIIIRDTGIGIPEDDLTRIFERFYRVDKARSRSEGGTGLGLAIVKHIIEAHNSKILVKSKLNSGSEFSFRLKK